VRRVGSWDVPSLTCAVRVRTLPFGSRAIGNPRRPRRAATWSGHGRCSRPRRRSRRPMTTQQAPLSTHAVRSAVPCTQVCGEYQATVANANGPTTPRMVATDSRSVNDLTRQSESCRWLLVLGAYLARSHCGAGLGRTAGCGSRSRIRWSGSRRPGQCACPGPDTTQTVHFASASGSRLPTHRLSRHDRALGRGSGRG
jgi:hypothetical protein